MRAEAVSRNDWSAEHAAPLGEKDKWHVALAPGEVKIVSLEQLDDLFRLSIVDAETKVWQHGMSEWQPLRVIADLDDTPAPEPKRSPPKPPSPRSAPPPPRPQSVAPAVPPMSPSVRPTPPPPRPQSVAPAVPPMSSSVRPAAPAPRPQSVAPAAVFAAPLGLAATQPAFLAPIAVQPIASVRPLVVSARPPVVRSGGLGRFLIGLSLVAGLGISLYRNGVLYDAARAMHQDALFTRLEGAFGGPAFGTLRAIEQGSAARPGSNLNSDLNASLAADAPVMQKAAPTQKEAAAPGTARAPGNGAAQAPVVSLESLAPLEPEKPGAKAKVEPPVAASPAPKPAAQTNFGAAPQAKAARKPTVVVKPATAGKSPSEMTERQRLNAAIGQSMFATPSKSKASKASEYDPLNPKL